MGEPTECLAADTPMIGGQIRRKHPSRRMTHGQAYAGEPAAKGPATCKWPLTPIRKRFDQGEDIKAGFQSLESPSRSCHRCSDRTRYPQYSLKALTGKYEGIFSDPKTCDRTLFRLGMYVREKAWQAHPKDIIETLILHAEEVVEGA